MTDQELPPLPEPSVTYGRDLRPMLMGPLHTADQLRAYGLQCYRMGVEAERERCIKAAQSSGPKYGPLKLITDGFVAAIRGTGRTDGVPGALNDQPKGGA